MHFKEALSRPGTNIIAEFKRASPSLGDIDASADPVEKSRIYESGGAAAMSVLCDTERFNGGIWDLRRVAESGTSLPLLCKDFITAPERLAEAKDAGASAALLIVRFLDDALLGELLSAARSLGLDALVEAHSEEEVARAVAAGADIVGVNCRDLSDFTVDVSISERLLGAIPDGIVKVAESGIRSRADIERLAGAGANAFLVGTTLMKSPDPAATLRALRGAD